MSEEKQRKMPVVSVSGRTIHVQSRTDASRVMTIRVRSDAEGERQASLIRGFLADAFHAGMQEEQRRVERTHEDGHYTIQTEDIGRGYIEAFGKSWSLAGVIGRVQPRDVGKRIFYRGGVVQVENDQQRDQRMARAVAGPNGAQQVIR